jgi:hypothetical protein
VNPCERYLRLFNLKKYREIQPVIDSIAYRNVDCQQVIPLVEAAWEISKLDDFVKYNDPDMREVHDEDFGDLLKVLQKEELLSWLDAKSNRIQALRNVVFLICCPKYRESLFDGEDAGTTIGYIDTITEIQVCPLNSLDWIGILDSIERIPVGDVETSLHIYSRKQLMEMDRDVSLDLFTLSQLDEGSSKGYSDKRLAFLEFYNDFKKIINLAMCNPDYTILNENSFI